MLFLSSTSPYSSKEGYHFHFQHQRRVSDSLGSVISRTKRYCQDQEQTALLYVACGTPFSDEPSLVIRRSRVSHASLLGPVVRRSSELAVFAQEHQIMFMSSLKAAVIEQ